MPNQGRLKSPALDYAGAFTAKRRALLVDELASKVLPQTRARSLRWQVHTVALHPDEDYSMGSRTVAAA